MNLLEAVILGLVQGITEFFPISSSAHLTLARWFLGIENQEGLVYLDLTCHLGTLLALLIYLRSEIWQALTSKKTFGLLFLALIPLVPAYFLLKPLRVAASDPSYLAYSLLITSIILFIASRKKIITSTLDFKESKWKSVLCIGVMQTMALIPGISRSGSTIGAARLLGWDWVLAAKFSFLLAIPTILGGELLETVKLWSGHGALAASISPSCYAASFLASFGMGLVGVRFVFSIYEKQKVRPFAWYCLGVAFIAWLAFHG